MFFIAGSRGNPCRCHRLPNPLRLPARLSAIGAREKQRELITAVAKQLARWDQRSEEAGDLAQDTVAAG